MCCDEAGAFPLVAAPAYADIGVACPAGPPRDRIARGGAGRPAAEGVGTDPGWPPAGATGAGTDPGRPPAGTAEAGTGAAWLLLMGAAGLLAAATGARAAATGARAGAPDARAGAPCACPTAPGARPTAPGARAGAPCARAAAPGGFRLDRGGRSFRAVGSDSDGDCERPTGTPAPLALGCLPNSARRSRMSDGETTSVWAAEVATALPAATPPWAAGALFASPLPPRPAGGCSTADFAFPSHTSVLRLGSRGRALGPLLASEIASSAFPSSVIDAKRSSRFLASVLSTSASTSAGISGLLLRSGSGASWRCRVMTWIELIPRNGTCPTSIS